MKFKKLGTVVALVVSAVVLTACGTNDKEKFIKDSAILAKSSTQKFNFKTDDLNLHPIMISQIGIHDSDGNLLAICKPNQPIKKYWHDILSFNIKIRI